MRRAAGLLLLLLLLGACGGDDKTLVTPEPEPAEDSFLFYVYTVHEGGEELLRWIGTPAGPSEDSPEPTSVPWIGYGQPFRVEWRISSANGAITGYRWRASIYPTVYLPSPSTWGEATSFTYLNSFAAEDLEGENCESGPECPARLRLDSGRHSLYVLAIDETGVETLPEDGALSFEINYPPETAIRRDGVHECSDDPPFPRYRALRADGNLERCSFVDGDTIPAGAVVTLELGGWDRLASHGFPDSFCCDSRLEDLTPEVVFQGRLDFWVWSDGGYEQSFRTDPGPVTPGNRLEFHAGPFDYTFWGQALDELEREDPTPDPLSFSAGFRPRILSLSPPDGARIVLRDPRGGPASPTWPENEVEYTVEGPTTLYWDIAYRSWLPFEGEGRIPLSGYWFQIPTVFTGAPHPRETLLDPALAGEYVGSIRSWAYEWVGEHDPDNDIPHGAGNDRLYLFRSPSPPVYDLWRMEGEDAPAIFVPSLFWDEPEAFDPQGTCGTPLCDVGAELLKELGTVQLTVIGKTTATYSLWQQRPPAAPGVSVPSLEWPLYQYGRRSDPGRARFTIHLGLDDGTGNLGETFPP